MSAGIIPPPRLAVQVQWDYATWSDITKLVRKLKIDRGRQHVLSQFEPGRLDLTCWGEDRSLDPTNTTGIYGANVAPDAPIRVLAWWNQLDAQSGALSVTAGWTATGAGTVSYTGGQAKITSTGSGTFGATTATGTNGFPVYASGSYSATVTFGAGTALNGSIGIAWYTAAGALISTTSSTSGAVSGQTVTLSATAPATAAFGALVVNVTATASGQHEQFNTAGVFPGATPSPWTAGGGTALFTGALDQLDPLWLDNLRTDDHIQATDAMRQMNADLISSTYLSLITGDGATSVWTFGDPITQAGGQAADSVGSHPGTYSGGYQLGANGPSYTDPTTAVAFSGVGGMMVAHPWSGAVGSNWSVEFWFQAASPPSGPALLFGQPFANPTYTDTPYLQVSADGSLLLVDRFARTIAASGNHCNGIWHHCVITVAVGGATGTLYVDGVAVGALTDSGGWALNSTGLNEGFQIGSLMSASNSPSTTFGPLAASFAYAAYYPVALTGAQVTNHYNYGFTGYPLQDTGTRISTAVTQSMGYPPPLSIQTGQSLVSQPQGDLTTTSVLSYCQQVADTEDGYLFVNAGGTLTFLNRTAALTSPGNVSTVTFGDGAGGVPYRPSPDIGTDVTDLYNVAFVSRQTGVVSIQGLVVGGASSVPQTWNNAASQANYHQQATYRKTGLLLISDSECLSRAQWVTTLYGTILPRVRSLAVNVLADPARFSAAISTDLLARVTVKRRPWDSTSNSFGSPVWTQDEYIEGISHEIDFTKGPTWTATYRMWPALTTQFWVLGDATLGVLGSTTRLAW